MEYKSNGRWRIFLLRATDPIKSWYWLWSWSKRQPLANMKAGQLDKKIGDAIVQAADEKSLFESKYVDQFVVDVIRRC
ncbi:hypothetical protein JT739_06305 [Tepidanaerobacter sp. GT38]|uniref:hypothetical protein n=1 Tax=Tepidanaerobacter sp. GT38 TaxID=2722793 RepID=UPI001F4201DD|nr:hypothetical protein [Tepidanaerobacter sp. GT38]MCG1012214.1 hypothetical protein [Tepidanaerobacter sp. GT38]